MMTPIRALFLYTTKFPLISFSAKWPVFICKCICNLFHNPNTQMDQKVLAEFLKCL